MAGAVTLFIAITLSGIPATIACVTSCSAEPGQTTAGPCHDHASTAAATSRITSGAEECDTTLNVTPFLVETPLRLLTAATAHAAVITPTTSHASVVLASPDVFIQRRADGPPLLQLRSTILRI